MTKLEELKEVIETYEYAHDDGDQETLEKAFKKYCSMHDERTAFIFGLLETVNDQINNHPEDDSDEDVQEIINLLDRK